MLKRNNGILGDYYMTRPEKEEKNSKLAKVKIANDEHADSVAGEGDRTRSDE